MRIRYAMELKGIYVPNVTPFDRHGRIDE